MMFALHVITAALPLAIQLPGTQPGELALDLRPPSVCRGCHGYYADSANDSWDGTMMANSLRDPLFRAALTVAEQDEPGAGDLCLRCHTPRGWLMGRSMPSDGSALIAGDDEGVQCDFCHRLRPGRGDEKLIGNAQYFVADDFIRRGPIPDAVAPHETQYSSYFEESELCGLCHDVSNPLRGGFAIERTYTEWTQSAFAAEGTTCQTCHLRATAGFACGASNAPERVVHRHELAGGNTWMPLVLAGEHPELGRQEAFERTARRAAEVLREAAELAIDAPASARRGEPLHLTVRVENLTGHKLPTGYPEGRRMWLEVEVVDAAGRALLRSGAYDADAAERIDDPQLRTYEVKMAAGGQEGFHFILQDELLQDNRIPPRGFVPDDQTRPVGRRYATLPDGALAHWDDAPYEIAIPVAAPGDSVAVRATLWYQTTSREYVEFLRDQNRTDDRGERMFELWETYDRAPPFAMASVEAEIEIGPLAPEPEPEPDGDGGCRAAPGAAVGFGGWSALLVGAPWFLQRKRRRL
jgi:hypothetical protein